MLLPGGTNWCFVCIFSTFPVQSELCSADWGHVILVWRFCVVLCSCGWRWMISPHCIWSCGAFPFSYFISREIFPSLGHSIFQPSNEARISPLVCLFPRSFPPVPPWHSLLLHFPFCSIPAPRGPRLPVACPVGRDPHRRCSCSQGRRWLEHSALSIPGILDMIALFRLSPPTFC